MLMRADPTVQLAEVLLTVTPASFFIEAVEDQCSITVFLVTAWCLLAYLLPLWMIQKAEKAFVTSRGSPEARP